MLFADPGKLVRLTQLADEREQRQVHGNNHAADHHAQKHDHDRLKGRQQVFYRGVDFIFIKVRDLLQHGVHRAGLFADADHLGDHAGKNLSFTQRLGQRLAFFEGPAKLHQSLFFDRLPICAGLFADADHLGDHAGKNLSFTQRLGQRLAFFERPANFHQSLLYDSIPRGFRGDVQAFEDGYAAGDERTEGTCEARHGNFSEQHTNQRRLQKGGVDYVASLGRSVPNFDPKNRSHECDQEGKAAITPDEGATADAYSGRQGQRHAQACEQRCKDGHDFPEQQDDDARGDGQNTHWVNQRGFYGALQLDVFFDVLRKALQNGIENTARFAGFHHVDI